MVIAASRNACFLFPRKMNIMMTNAAMHNIPMIGITSIIPSPSDGRVIHSSELYSSPTH
jgi:hypothetical protein